MSYDLLSYIQKNNNKVFVGNHSDNIVPISIYKYLNYYYVAISNYCLFQIKQKNTAEYHSIYTDGNFERVIKYYLDHAYGPIKPTVYFGKNTVPVSSSTLQNINIKDFSGTLYEVSYINYVLAHFRHLRVFEVTPVEEMEEEEILAYAELFSMFPRVSTDVYMLVGSEEVWKSGWVR